MPQNIAQKYQQAVRAKQRAQPFTEAEDLQLFNTLLKLNEEEDPSIEESRGLTVDKKRWDEKKADIDIASGSFANYLLDKDLSKDGAIRDDLNIKDITNMKKALPELIGHLHTLNPEKDAKAHNYINSLGVKFTMGIAEAEKVAYTKDSVAKITRALNDLGDDERMEGKWNLPDTQFLMENIKNAHNQSLSEVGGELKSEYQPTIDYLNDKRYVFDTLDYISKNQNAIAQVNASPKALANLVEAARIMRTPGEEDIGLARKLLEEIPKFTGASAEKRMDRAIVKRDEDSENKLLKHDTKIRVYKEQLSGISESIGDKHLDKSFREWNIFNLNQADKGALADPDIAELDKSHAVNTFIVQLRGIDGFNQDIAFDEAYGSDLDIKDEVAKKHWTRVLTYFLDPTELKKESTYRRQGMKTVGEVRLSKINSGGKDTAQKENARTRITLMAKIIREHERFLGQQRVPKEVLAEQLQAQDLEKLQKKYPEMFKMKMKKSITTKE